jgi:hypothetical protein
MAETLEPQPVGNGPSPYWVEWLVDKSLLEYAGGGE